MLCDELKIRIIEFIVQAVIYAPISRSLHFTRVTEIFLFRLYEFPILSDIRKYSKH